MVAYVPDINERDLKKYALSLQQLGAGRSNAYGTVTCTTLSKTTVTDANCAVASKIGITASSSNACAFITSIWVSSTGVVNGSFTLDHTVASTTDRTFGYTIQG